MKILAIRIKNLASLEGDTEIDFTKEPLCSAGIFAITGATGAGKSTILDALCLALYAKTPRYLQAKETGIDVQDIGGGTISQSDIRGILRDGTAEGFAEVDFVGIDGQRYRATWNIRRARNKAAGSLQAYSVALKNINTGADIAGKKTELLPEIERLVGLTFEQFTRSVLLAQGDFTAFLKAPKDEKSSLLEKLTGTQIYSAISQRIFEKHRDESQQLRDLNLKREGIPTLSLEELEAYIQQKAAFEINIQELEKQADQLSREINWHTQLATLQIHFTAADEKYTKALEGKTNAVERAQKLKQAESIQSARSLVEAKQQTEKQLAEKVLALKETTSLLTELQKQQEELETLSQNANEDLVAKTKAREEAKPLLENAKVLDVQITERTALVATALREQNTALENKKKQEDLWREKQQIANQLLAEIDALKKWKEENKARQPVAENQGLIVSKLDDSQKQLTELMAVTNTIDTTNNNIERETNEKEKLVAESSTIGQQLQAAQQAYDKLLAALSAVDVSMLENEQTALDGQLEDLIGAQAHWKLLFSKLSDLKIFNQKLVASKEEAAQKEILLKAAVVHFNNMQVQRDASLRMLEKARLAAAENIDLLRQQLQPGEPCPVCGSEDHPYSLHNPQLDNVLSALEADHHKNELDFRESLKKQTSLQEMSTQLKRSIAEQETAVASNESELKFLQAEWIKFAAHKNCADLPDEQKANRIQEQLLAKKDLQKRKNEQLQSYHQDKKQLDKQQQLLIKFDALQNENANKIKDADRLLESQLEQLQQANNSLEKLNKELSATEKKLTPYFSASDWFSQWKKDPAKFVERINAFAVKWKADMQKLDEDARQHSVLLETLRSMQDQSKSLAAELEKKETILAGLTVQVKELNEKRKLIFNGQAVLKIEAGLQQAVDATRLALDTHNANRQTLQTSITRFDSQKEQTGKEISKLELELTQKVDTINHWLVAHNAKNDSSMDEPGLLQLLDLKPEWIETERAFLRIIDDTITQAASVLNERRELLEAHEKQRISEKQPEELNVLLSEVKELLKKSTEDKNQAQFQLEQDAANKKTIGTLLDTINAQAMIVENWAKLNDIIGSADGKKFRQIAQEYTLDILLGYANVHLELLSKRYLLQRIPDTLGLQVLDQDMGNEIRTVFSLSGGESFLVSLALALGLASLSSSRMQVESLFIDEGFGSLDPATLNIAMDALERLHNQGRKVGVISHVQEMTERIAVQIKVSKRNSGRSVVEVVGV
ncbi:SbcC/MukB-like Walker B domain-containing protein [soil metagenome]